MHGSIVLTAGPTSHSSSSNTPPSPNTPHSCPPNQPILSSYSSHNSYLLPQGRRSSPPKAMHNHIHDRETTSSSSTTSSSTFTTLTTINTGGVGGGEGKLSLNSADRTYWASNSTLSSSSFHKPHATSYDPYWNAVRSFHPEAATLSLEDVNFVQKLGSGDIGTVYLVELKSTKGCMFAAKVMDKEEMAYRNKESRAKIEKEILEMLDHPFLPILYSTLESPKWFCLLTEFCPGGDLHVLRQQQPDRRFDESAVRFYAAEIIAALEYLHMLGVIYRDLKPENVLVRANGHIMLTDFDLCLKCNDSETSAQLVSTSLSPLINYKSRNNIFSKPSCILPTCMAPSVTCSQPRLKNFRKKKPGHHHGALKLVTEPIEARSMSFVGTHEYLAPEIVSGEGHGSSVDWWTLGVFIYELFYGVTPFRGLDHDFTLTNIVARGLEFPKEPALSNAGKDLITQLLIKDPSKRMGSTMGAPSIKNHPFFHKVNWALLRSTTPPIVPGAFDYGELMVTSSSDYDAGSIDYY